MRDAVLLPAAPMMCYAAARLVAARFFRRERARKLRPYTPAVSVVKPVHGVDFGSNENFASFRRQDHPEYEILFAVDHAANSAVAVIHQVMAEFPVARHAGLEWQLAGPLTRGCASSLPSKTKRRQECPHHSGALLLVILRSPRRPKNLSSANPEKKSYHPSSRNFETLEKDILGEFFSIPLEVHVGSLTRGRARSC